MKVGIWKLKPPVFESDGKVTEGYSELVAGTWSKGKFKGTVFSDDGVHEPFLSEVVWTMAEFKEAVDGRAEMASASLR